MRPITAPRRRLRPAAALAAAAALVLVAGCGSAETAALDAQDSATTEATDEPTDEPTEDDPTTEPTEEPTTAPTPSPTPSPTAPVSVAPKVGECRNLNAIDIRARIVATAAPAVACTAGHNAQTYKVASLNAATKAAITSGNRLQAFVGARRQCELDLPAWLGVDDARQKQSKFDFAVGVPTSAEVSSGATWVRCDVTLMNGSTKVELVPNNTKNALRGKKGDGYMSCIRSSNLSFASGTFLCRDAHNWRSVTAIKLGVGSDSFPGTGDVTRTLRSRCATEVRRYLDTSGSFQYGWLPPSADQWKYGDRWGVCFAKTRR